MSGPSKEALEAAKAWLERYEEAEVNLTDDDLALALDAFAQQARDKALEEEAAQYCVVTGDTKLRQLWVAALLNALAAD